MVKYQPLNNPALTVAIIALVTSFGIPLSENVLSNELDDYYICRATGQIEEFKGGISGTGLTGYPYADSRSGYIRCKAEGINSEWVKLELYAEEVNLDPYSLLSDQQEPTVQKEIVQVGGSSQAGAKESCDFEGCKPI